MKLTTTAKRNGTPPAATGEEAPSSPTVEVGIAPLHLKTATFKIRGTAPLVIHKFSARPLQIMRERQAAGSTAKGKKNREAKDFDALWKEATYTSPDGWHGINASAFRSGIIAVCRLVDFKMTLARLSIFCVADGYDIDGTPLVRITKGQPHKHEGVARNATGVCDIRSRPMWDPGWEADVTLRWDADQFTISDVTNLLHRMGAQNGIGEGRMNSKQSNGCGWGSFEIVND